MDNTDLDDTEVEDRVERALRAYHGSSPDRPQYRLRHDPVWLVLTPAGAELPEHGWKLHVSARAATFPDLVDRLVPFLLREGCQFKLARSRRVLTRLNNGYSSPATVGKAVTIYPDQQRVRALGFRLAELLRGEEGPRVLSDRAVDDNAPVYYRFGPFARSWNTDERGRLITVIKGPKGEEFGALATMRYRQPSWAIDPFTGQRGDDEAGQPAAGADSVVLGGHFRVLSGLYESGRGNVYRAIDERTGETVVVKQARAHVDEHDAAGDVRLRLRNERRVLQAIDGLPGVPRFIDHFRHGADEFLVTSDAGPRNLDEDVISRGRYVPEGERDLARLGADLARILLGLHGRGVIVRDLTARNVVVDDGRAQLIDFGLAAYDGVHVPGGTPGYAPARQRRHEPPRDTDDLHALGMTLYYAEGGLHPVTTGDDLDVPRQRALATIRLRYGDRPDGVMGIVADLLDDDAEVARDALRRLAADDPSSSTPAVRVLPAPPRLTPDLAAEISHNLLADLLDQTWRTVSAPRNLSIAHDASVYSGAAGVGLELLEHLDQPGVADCLRELLPFTVRAMKHVALPHGLMVGSTGVDIFVQLARSKGFDAGPEYDGPELPDRDWKPESDDIIVGAAGIGLGQVLLHRITGDPAHLAVARRLAESVIDHPVHRAAIDTDPLPPQAAVEPSAGRAHGLGGVTELLLCVGAQLRDDDLLDCGAERAAVLARRAQSLAERIQTPLSASLAVSWCQGLAGITQTLLYAADVLGDAKFLDQARLLGDVSTSFLPRISVVSQCCGTAGVGNMLIDLALHDDDAWYWDAATAAGVQMLLRGAGTREHPLFVEDDPDQNSASWAFGVAGILGYFRRISRREGTVGIPLPDWAGLATH